MKKIIAFAFAVTLSTQSVMAIEEMGPLDSLETNLTSILKKTEGRKTIAQMKSLANDRNVDLEIAFQNYLIAKKKVSVARADFNPLRTSHVLGIALGVNYLWVPFALDTVLSIPMKIHNVHESQYLKQAAFHNLNDAREALNNEMAHLYFDILTHEALLKTIDQEIKVLNFYEARLVDRKADNETLEELKGNILRLQIERTDIYDLYLKELSAVRTLLQMDDTHKFELAHIDQELNRSITYGLDIKKLKEFALANSHKYKMSVNIHRASQSNVKSVKWSILSADGLNFSYKKRVKVAKNEERVAALQRQSTELLVKNNVKLQLEKLDSSLTVLGNYSELANQSLDMFVDQYELFQAGRGSEDVVVSMSITAIRDFRSKIVSHYNTWASLDDFSDSANHNFSVANQNILSELESKPLYFVSREDFSITKASNGNNSYILFLDNLKGHDVASVEYRFTDNKLPTRKITGDRKFALLLDNALPESVTGLAIVKFANGYELDYQF